MSTAAKHFLFFYQFAPAYLMSKVVFQDRRETICSPWHKSLSSGGPSSSLTFIFTFFQVICSTWSENPLMERGTFGDWRDISSFTCKCSRLKRRRLIIGQERVCLSVCPSIHLYICLWRLTCFFFGFTKRNKKMYSYTSVRSSCLWSCYAPYSSRCQIFGFLSEKHTQYTVTLKPGFKQSEHLQRCL